MTHCRAVLNAAFVLAVICACCLMVGVAQAGSVNDSFQPASIDDSIEINVTCATFQYQYCSFNTGGQYPLGNPASGNANFNPLGYPWSFTFETAPPLTYTWYEESNYSATFGYGGTFMITGPEGTFSGVVTGGEASQSSNGNESVGVTYFGRWSDGTYADGSVSLAFNFDEGTIQANFNEQPAPEPGSLLLLGSGVLGLGGLSKLRRRS